MWTYQQKTGRLSLNGRLVAVGYSGQPGYKNDPTKQHLKGLGPIPRGKWKITEKYDSKNVGPFTLKLQAVDVRFDDVHDVTGRSAFRIHGDSIRNPGSASNGCIILSRHVRELIWNSGDRDLEVVA